LDGARSEYLPGGPEIIVTPLYTHQKRTQQVDEARRGVLPGPT